MGLNRSCVLLIVIAGIERFAFKGVASNLVTYLTDVEGMSNSSAARMVNSWCGFTSILPLLIAPLADSYWNRRSTILASAFIYISGLLALTLTAMASERSPENKRSLSVLFSSLCTISVGLAGYSPSLQAFGTDQLEAEEEKEEALPPSKAESGCGQPPDKKSPFFQWWYFGVCTGSLLGTTLLSYVEDTFGWVIGFAIPMGAMVASTVLFCCGSKIYAAERDSEINKRPFRWISKAVTAVASKFVSSRSSRIRLPDEDSELGVLELQGKPLCHPTNRPGEKDAGKSHMIDNVKVVLRLLPIWITLLMFAVIFQQPNTFFTKQGAVMKRTMGTFKVPPATLQSAITLSIVLLMPLYDKALIPAARFFTRNEKGINVLQRMGVGMVLSIIAMVIAAQVETKRLEVAAAGGPDKKTAPMSILWLLPQYILLGISDVFTVVGMQEFFYSQVPLRMRTMGFALYTGVFGVGSFVSALMISIVESATRGRQGWFSDDMSKGRLDKYYWLLALTSVISLLVYMALCKVYRGQSNTEEGEIGLY
ncbi:hypothetical protein SAY86_016067 [Trapa natans]|uniref:Uncharacterized protein n=1 Tax=Trapa natans TaxID=22666 RepID=A0AAN7LBK5_TRANT|nr:hypothetical protein SAY86_016067 [Trapa natans]